MGMKQILVMMAAVVLVGCSNDTRKAAPDPADEKLITDPIVEKAVRKKLEKPTGELNGADFEKVTDLKLDRTQITDSGLKELTNMRNLTEIGLQDTKITDSGLKELTKLQKLTTLGLSDTKITDEGLKEVAKLQELALLTLRGPQVTKAGVAELKKALPNCRIYGP